MAHDCLERLARRHGPWGPCRGAASPRMYVLGREENEQMNVKVTQLEHVPAKTQRTSRALRSEALAPYLLFCPSGCCSSCFLSCRFSMRSIRACTGLDRKSTRLNSSHEWNSYAVF